MTEITYGSKLVIPTNRLAHCYTAGKILQQIAVFNDESIEIQAKYFLLGYLHDCCYDFQNKNLDDNNARHDTLLSNILSNFDSDFEDAIRYHSRIPNFEINNVLLDYLYIADTLSDGVGSISTPDNRIVDLKTRYGEDSDIVKEQYEIIDYLIKKGYSPLIDKLYNYFTVNCVEDSI